MFRSIAILLLVLALALASVATTAQVVPTTTLAAETQNNTSAADAFRLDASGNATPGNVSNIPMTKLLYPGATTRIYAHFMPWFGRANGHVNVGYDSTDAMQVQKQVEDAIRRGISGFIVDWYGPDGYENKPTLLLKAEAEKHPGFEFAVMVDKGALFCRGCDVTAELTDQARYILQTYATSPAYMRIEGRPAIFEFDVDLHFNVDWQVVAANLSGDPAFVFGNAHGFVHAASAGAYAWVQVASASSSSRSADTALSTTTLQEPTASPTSPSLTASTTTPSEATPTTTSPTPTSTTSPTPAPTTTDPCASPTTTTPTPATASTTPAPTTTSPTPSATTTDPTASTTTPTPGMTNTTPTPTASTPVPGTTTTCPAPTTASTTPPPTSTPPATSTVTPDPSATSTITPPPLPPQPPLPPPSNASPPLRPRDVSPPSPPPPPAALDIQAAEEQSLLWNNDYLLNFYAVGLAHPKQYTFGAVFKGFNDTTAAWTLRRFLDQQCGDTWLSAWDKINSIYSFARQLDAIQIVTWNDYEEGTGIEPGIDPCLTVSAALAGSTLQFSVSGNGKESRTVDHYSVFVSTDQQNLMKLAELPVGVGSLDLTNFSLGPGTYYVYVKMESEPGLLTSMSDAVTYTRTQHAGPITFLPLPPTPPFVPPPQQSSAGGSQKLLPPAAATPATPAGPPLPFQHVAVVILENENFDDVIGSPSMPYLNTLISQYALATQLYAVTHPSIDNYFMLTTGAEWANNNDDWDGVITADTVVDELTKAGKTWKSYAGSLPAAGYLGGDSGEYMKHHNPFTYFAAVRNNPAQAANVVPMTQLASDIATGQLPNYLFIVPDAANDSHNCPGGESVCDNKAKLAAADNWLKTEISALLANPGFQSSGVLLITYDEALRDNTLVGGRIAAVIVTPRAKSGYMSRTLYQQDSVARFTLEALGLSSFPGAASKAPNWNEFFTQPYVK